MIATFAGFALGFFVLLCIAMGRIGRLEKRVAALEEFLGFE